MKKLILPISIILFSACKKSKPIIDEIDQGVIVKEYDGCNVFYPIDGDTSVVIADQTTLDNLNNTSPNCSISSVDFSQNIVLHYQFNITWNFAHVWRYAVYDDALEKKYKMICFIDESIYDESGFGLVKLVFSSTVIVPKPPSDYTFEFEYVFL